MATSDKHAAARRSALSALKTLQDQGRRVFRTGDFQPEDRRRLLNMGYLDEVLRGWFIISSPANRKSDTTAWHASYWQFIAGYFNDRFGADWVLSPAQSLALHAENMTVPKQILVYSSAASNNMTKLPHGSSIYDNRSKTMPTADEAAVRNGLRLWTPATALVRVPEHYFAASHLDVSVVLRSMRDIGEVVEALISPPRPVVAGRLANAFRQVDREDAADEIVDSFRRLLGQRVVETNQFKRPVFGLGNVGESPISLRLRGMWQESREHVIDAFNEADVPPAAAVNDIDSYMRDVDEIYRNDAYNSLSIEGYKITDGLIARVSTPDWDPYNDDGNKADHDALAARGYFQAFSQVKEAVRRVVNGGDSASELRTGYLHWYQEMFQPMVAVGLLQAKTLVRHRSHQVYLRGSRHVPPQEGVVNEAMNTLMDLIAKEPKHSVRAVLGHWIFGYVHPFGDGNGRAARFAMNVLLAGGGYPWTVIRVEDRADYLDSLEAASVEHDIHPFARFIAERVRWSLDNRPRAKMMGECSKPSFTRSP